MKKNYYVYSLIDPFTGLPFYIGKGKDDRAESHLRLDKGDIYNQRKRKHIETLLAAGKKIDIKFYLTNVTSKEASCCEIELIKQYGRLDFDHNGILLNLTKGGEGGDTSAFFTAESRKKMSDSRAGVKNPQAKLTETQVVDIYHSTESTTALAEKYKVGSGQICGIKRKKYYLSVTKDITELPGRCINGKKIRTPMPGDIVRKIYTEEGGYSYFLEKYHATRQVVINIKCGKTYKHDTKDLGEPGRIRRHKLTELDVIDIFDNSASLTDIAEKYGIHPETVRNIKKNITRKYYLDDF